MQSLCFCISFSREIIYKDTTRNEYHATTWLFICKSLYLNIVTSITVFFWGGYQYSILLTESELHLLCYISATIDLRLGWSTKTLLTYRQIRVNDTCSLIVGDESCPMSKTYNLWSRFIGLGWGGDEGGGDTWDEDNYISICKIILAIGKKKLTIEYSWFFFFW